MFRVNESNSGKVTSLITLYGSSAPTKQLSLPSISLIAASAIVRYVLLSVVAKSSNSFIKFRSMVPNSITIKAPS